MEEIHAVYRVSCTPEEAPARAEDIALEQTVEVPAQLITDPEIQENVVAKVTAITADPEMEDAQRISITYNAALANGHLPQLLNLLYGNISIKPDIALTGLTLPDSLLAKFPGPHFGMEGIRAQLGVYKRPLLATAIKPRGSSYDTLAKIAGDFALGGGDIVKDDHNICDDSFEDFRERVSRCHDALRAANAKTGGNTLYLPNVLAPTKDIERYVQYLAEAEVPGLLISPMAAGLDMVRHLAETYPLIYMGHPALSGSYYTDPRQGFAPDILLGMIFRLMGCDASVFPNYGGRFGLTESQCLNIQRRLLEPLGTMKPSLAAPAGGMDMDRVHSMATVYGEDAIFLIGGALLSYSDDLVQSTQAFQSSILDHFEEERRTPQPAFASACEVPGGDSLDVRDLLPFLSTFEWEHRPATEYKASQELPFQGVKRIELIGKAGERTAFDLRYFELEAGGYTSHEKHVHTHTIITVRGEGTLVQGEATRTLQPFDIAFVDSLEPHQLKNESKEPFGFFCIVDHDRDRPMPAR